MSLTELSMKPMGINSTRTLQIGGLNLLRLKRIECSIFQANGIRLTGRIVSFDEFTVLLLINGDANQQRGQLVYKHAMSTIFPSRDISLDDLRRIAE